MLNVSRETAAARVANLRQIMGLMERFHIGPDDAQTLNVLVDMEESERLTVTANEAMAMFYQRGLRPEYGGGNVEHLWMEFTEQVRDAAETCGVVKGEPDDE